MTKLTIKATLSQICTKNQSNLLHFCINFLTLSLFFCFFGKVIIFMGGDAKNLETYQLILLRSLEYWNQNFSQACIFRRLKNTLSKYERSFRNSKCTNLSEINIFNLLKSTSLHQHCLSFNAFVLKDFEITCTTPLPHPYLELPCTLSGS